MNRSSILLFLTVSVVPHLFAELPQMVGEPASKEGAYFNFFIKTVSPDADGDIVITAAALDGKDSVSFELVVGRKWETGAATLARLPKEAAGLLHEQKPDAKVDPAIVEARKRLQFGRVTIRSVGAPTEAFVRGLARTLKVKVSKYQFSEAEFAATSLGNYPSRMQTEAIDLKLTIGAVGQKVFAPLNCHVDIPNRFVQLQEENPKERKWREDLVLVLTRPTSEQRLEVDKDAAQRKGQPNTTQPSSEDGHQ